LGDAPPRLDRDCRIAPPPFAQPFALPAEALPASLADRGSRA
jgi:hypothetical protein